MQGYFDKYPTSNRLTVPDWAMLVRRYTKDQARRDRCLEAIKQIKKQDIPDPKFIEDTLVAFAKRQLTKLMIMEGLNLLEQPELDLQTLQEYLDKAATLTTTSQTEFYRYFDDPKKRLIEEVRVAKAPTGIDELDDKLEGGLEPGELMIILAPPERGKTLMMINLGYAALQAGMVVFHSTHEISARKVARRYDLRITGREFREIVKDEGRLEDHLHKLKKKGADLVIKDYSDKSARIEDLRAAVINYMNKTKRKPDLLIVDYADLLVSSKDLKERFELKELYTNLRRLGQSLKIPVITGSQSTRKAASKQIIDKEDFAEAYSKAAIADVIISMCQTPEEEEDGLVRLHIAKSRRMAGHPTFRVAMDANRQYIGSLDGLPR